MQWLRGLSLRSKFFIIIFLIVCLLVFSLINFWYGMRVMSGIRAYVGGEGIWSKAQKEAVASLIRYTTTYEETDYQQFLTYLSIPLGDKQARLELEKETPDLFIVQQGFIQGANNADDIDDLIFLYRQFRHERYMAQAIQTWKEGDSGIERLIGLGEQIHLLVREMSEQPDARLQAEQQLTLAALTGEIYELNTLLTRLENRFSSILGEAARQTAELLLIETIILTVLLGAITVAVALVIETMLFRIDKAKNEFVSLASHQLRTPMTIINWYVERLTQQKTLSSEQKKDIAEIFSASRRMVNLINDLLHTSRIELGTMRGESVELDPREVANQVIHDLQPEQEEKQVMTQTMYQEGMPYIIGDRKLLTMIFQNLLSNAVKYSQKNGVVRLKVFCDTKYFFIEVSDQGCGIPLHQQKKIFTKMFRADNARAIDPEGSGLGLYIVKAIVDATSGKINFTSRENEGTVFIVRFPKAGMVPKR